MPFPLLIPIAIGIGAAIWGAAQESKSSIPAAGLTGRYTDDGDGLCLTLSGWSAKSNTALVLHGRTSSGQFLKAAHSFFADNDGDFCVAKPVRASTCDFYLPHGVILGPVGGKLTISARLIEQSQDESGVRLLSEDILTLEAAEKQFSIIDYLRPLLIMVKAVAEVDGALAREEVRFIRELVKNEFSPSTAEMNELRVLLKTGFQVGPLEAATILKYRLPSPMLDAISSVLRGVALADGDANHLESQLMTDILVQLGMDDSELGAFVSSLNLVGVKHIEAYLAVLGLSGRPSQEALRSARRKAMMDFHPDRYHGVELPDAVKSMIARRGAEINEAYDALHRHFGYGGG